MDCWKILPSLGVLLLAMPSVRAGDMEVKVRAARKACLLGEYKKGVEILADLYLDTSDPNHIYNQGRCFEQNGQNGQAILRFQEYLRKATTLSSEDVSAVRMRIDVLQASTDRHGKSAPADAVPATTTGPAPSPTAPTAAPLASSIPPSAAPAPTLKAAGITQSRSDPAPQPSQPVYKRGWFWSGVGAVVAGSVVTAVLLTSKSGAKSPPCASSGVVCVPR